MSSNTTPNLIARHLSPVTVYQDVRYGLRQLIKTPGFTFVAVLTLAIGIGVNTTIFSVINAVLLRSLPVPNPHELRVVNWTGLNASLCNYTGSGMGRTSDGANYADSFPYTAYKLFREKGEGLSDVFAFFPVERATAHTRGMASTADGMMASENFFDAYGSRMALGRTFAPEEGQIGAEPVAVISYRFWERYYSLDPNLLGDTLTINKNPFTIVGVLSKDFVGPSVGDSSDFYVPMSAQPVLRPGSSLDSSNHWWVQIMARMAPGADEAQAQASLSVLFTQILNDSDTSMDRPGVWLQDGSRGPLVRRSRMAQPFFALLGLVGLVLIVACANLASLLLVRGAARRHEMAVRTAIGAGRWRLIRQSLTESMVLSIAGAGLGLLFALWCKEYLLVYMLQFKDNLRFDLSMDSNVMLFALGLTVLTTVLFGLIPAIRASRVDPAEGLKERAANASPRLRMGKFLVAVQVGLSVLLVVGAGLLIQSFANLKTLDPGFDADNLLLFRLNASQAGYSERERTDFYENVQRSLCLIPGVKAAAFSNLALASGWRSESGFSLPDIAIDPDRHLQTCHMTVNDTFFSTMKMPIVLGRDFSGSDDLSSSKVAVVNEAFVNKFLPDDPPVGLTVRMGNTDRRIVGVCGDAKYNKLQDDAPPILYFPHRQSGASSVFYEVRSTLPPLSLVPAVRKAVAAFDDTIPLESVKTQKQQMDESILFERLFAVLCGSLALLALFLSCIGLYGLMSYNVSRRRNEIGVRMALGARPCDVSRPILREAVVLAFCGIAFGVPIALSLAHLLSSVLYGVKPYDLTTLIGGVALMVTVAALSAWIPASRAAKTNPMTALRCE